VPLQVCIDFNDRYHQYTVFCNRQGGAVFLNFNIANNMTIIVKQLPENDSELWDAYVLSHPNSQILKIELILSEKN